MPNWCQNNLTLAHDDPAMITRVAQAFESGRLLQEFIPCPTELHEHISPELDKDRAARFLEQYGSTDWYNWQVSNWGTKWDVNGEIMSQSPDEIDLMFESAWSPPIAAYEHFKELGFRVRGTFHEPGMAFAGIWDDGHEDSIDYGGMTAEQVRTEFPELDEEFGISEMLEEFSLGQDDDEE